MSVMDTIAAESLSEVAAEARRQPFPYPAMTAKLPLESRSRQRPESLEVRMADVGDSPRGARRLHHSVSEGDVPPNVDMEAVAAFVAAAADATTLPPRAVTFPALGTAAIPTPPPPSSGNRSVLKPVKRSLDQAMCWFLGMEYVKSSKHMMPETPPSLAGSTRSHSVAGSSSPSDTSSTPTSTNPDTSTPVDVMGVDVCEEAATGGSSGSSASQLSGHALPVESHRRLTCLGVARPSCVTSAPVSVPAVGGARGDVGAVRCWGRGSNPNPAVTHEVSIGAAWQEDEAAYGPTPAHCGILLTPAPPMPHLTGARGLAARLWSGSEPEDDPSASMDISWQESRSATASARGSCGILGSGGGAKGGGTYLAQKLFPNCLSGGPRYSRPPGGCGSPAERLLSPDGALTPEHKVRDDQEEREELMRELFRLHDLNGDGVLEELELIQLNKKIAMLHHGEDVDKAEVTMQFSNLFRSKLDPTGSPVSYDVFRKYMFEALRNLDRNQLAQTMILEQFVAEADSAQRVFRSMSMYSISDEPLLQGVLVEPRRPTDSSAWTRKACTSEVSDVLSGVSTAQPEPQPPFNSDSETEGPLDGGI